MIRRYIMKRLYILMLACLGAVSVVAQNQRLKQRIIDRDYYPADSATVTVKGTNISTVTDRNGNFVLEDVPVILDSIEVTKNGKSKTLPIPIEITMTEALNDRYVAWYVKAGGGMTSVYGEGIGGGSVYAGGGMDVRLGRHWSYQMGLYYDYRVVSEDDYYGAITYYYHNLELPFFFAIKFRMANPVVMQVGLGGYISYTLGGEHHNDYLANNAYSGYAEGIGSDDRCGGGPLINFGWEIKRRWLLDVTGRFGWVFGGHGYDDTAYMDWSIGFGYKF